MESSATGMDYFWQQKLPHVVYQTPVVVGYLLLLAMQSRDPTARDSTLLAFDWHTAVPRWQKKFENSVITGVWPLSPPTVQNSAMLVATRSSDLLLGRGQLVVLDLTGNPLWTQQAEVKSYAAPAAAGKHLVTAVGSQTLQIALAFSQQPPTLIHLPVTTALAAPLVWQGVAFVPCQSNHLLAVDLTGRTIRWQFTAVNDPRAWLDKTPAFQQKTVYTTSSRGVVYAIDGETGELRWEQFLGEKRPLSPPIIAHNLLLVGTRRGLKALNPANGELIWHFPTERSVSAAPCVYGKTIFIGCEDHHVYALDLTTGAEKWRHALERRITISPVAVQDRIIVTDRGGLLVALPIAEETQSEAAEMLLAAGEWEKAAALWYQLDRLGRRAEALEQQAVWLDKQSVGAERKATAWETAARAYAEIDEKVARRRCEREVARHRRLPLLILTIQAKPLLFNAWSTLQYTVQNNGFSSARHIQIQVAEGNFIGRGKQTETLHTVRAERSHAHWLEVYPQAQGSAVPLHVAITYTDRMGRTHELTHTAYLTVSKERPLSESQAYATLTAPDGRNLAQLQQQIMTYFERDELKDLLLAINLLAGNFNDNVRDMSRGLIVYALQNGRYAELITLLQEKRPHVNW